MGNGASIDWWRLPGWPSADEWQAWWGLAGTLVAGVLLYVAWKQLSGLAESNRQLAESNRLLTESNQELSRPVVVVEYALEKHVDRDYSSIANNNTLYVIVQNVGKSAARDITLNVKPPFRSIAPRTGAKTIEFLNELFSGERPIKMLAPGQRMKYVLDDAGSALASEALPDAYEVSARYVSIDRALTFSDEFILELAPWAMSVSEAAPLKRISKDIQFISQSLRDREKGLPKIVSRLKDLQPAESDGDRRRLRGRIYMTSRVLQRRARR